jgi:ubiquinone biosynthesis protein COQ9
VTRAYKTSMTDEASDWAAQTEARLLDAAVPLVLRFGWTRRLAEAAGDKIGLTKAEVELLTPQGGRDLVALFSYRHDEAGLSALAGVDPQGLKMRERIARGVEARIEAAMADEAALRRWMGFLALPQNMALGGRLAWESADRIWRWAGDTSTDQNHYSKRAILAGLLSSTLAVRISGTPAAASTHLGRGIDAVMAFERAKAKLKGGDLASRAARALGAARYGAGRKRPGAPATPGAAAARSEASPTSPP